MSRELRQSTAQTERIGPYLDKTDGVTQETGLTPPTELSKDGGAFAAGPTGTHDTEGWYAVTFTTTHTNTLGSLMLNSQDPATHLAVWHEFMVITANEYDSKYGTDTREADVTQWLGVAVNALVSGRVDASVGAMALNVLTAAALATDAVNEIADGLLDRTGAIETGLTLREAQRLIAAASAAKLSGAATTTIIIRNAVADSKDRITATVDADGNRSAITYDLTT